MQPLEAPVGVTATAVLARPEPRPAPQPPQWLTEKWRRAEYLSASEEFAEDIGWFDLIDFVLLIVLVAMIVKAAMMVSWGGG